MTQRTNRFLILVEGKSATGKTASLMFLNDQEGVMYMNAEAGKELPFPSKFQVGNVLSPQQVLDALTAAEDMPEIHTVVIDSLDFLMNMYEAQKVIPAPNTMKAWGEYAQYFQKLMQKYVAASTKNIVIIAHTSDIYNESDLVMETMVKVKGSTMNQGVESYFCNVIAAKKITLKKLEPYENDLLVITPEEEILGFKYVFQTQLTKETVNERIRGSIGLWDRNHTYIDNNLQNVLDRLHAYYK
jgi:hypothetical protein